MARLRLISYPRSYRNEDARPNRWKIPREWHRYGSSIDWPWWKTLWGSHSPFALRSRG